MLTMKQKLQVSAQSISRLFIGLFAAALLSPVTVLSQQVFGSVDRDSVSVGDEVRYTLTVPRMTGVDEIVYPDDAGFGRDFEVTGLNTFSGVHSDSAVYRLRYFGVGDPAVPEMRVGLVSGIDTVWLSVPSLPMEFVSRVDDEDAAFRPFKPLYEFSISMLPYILMALVLALAGWLAWRYYHSRKVAEKPAPRIVEIPPYKDPLEALRQDLESIRADFPRPQDDYKGYYSRLGDAIRCYFEELYAIPALESTTSELAAELRHKLVHDTLQTSTLRILQQADMVKFAKFRPGPDQCAKAMDEARNFLSEAARIDGPRVKSMKLKHEELISVISEQ